MNRPLSRGVSWAQSATLRGSALIVEVATVTARSDWAVARPRRVVDAPYREPAGIVAEEPTTLRGRSLAPVLATPDIADFDGSDGRNALGTA
jgi:hypothetical protein